MALGKIIREKREQLDLTLDEVAALTSFSKPYLSTIETERVKNPPSDVLLQRLEQHLKFEPGQLQYLAHIESLPADIRSEFDACKAENRKYKQFINSIVDKKMDHAAIKRAISKKNFVLDETISPLNPGIWIPVINRVAAGYPVDFDDMGYPVGFADDYVRCPDLKDPNAFAVRVVGDSMEPRYFEGDIIVFSPAAEVQSGDDCFVRFQHPHETTFKRLFFEEDGKKIRLQPRNDKYAPTIVESTRVNGIYRAIIKYQAI